jgi:hypothetical protein
MEGVDKPPELKGMLPRAFDQIFEHINASSGAEFLVRASFLEIYSPLKAPRCMSLLKACRVARRAVFLIAFVFFSCCCVSACP